jgi:hypothetical protein
LLVRIRYPSSVRSSRTRLAHSLVLPDASRSSSESGMLYPARSGSSRFVSFLPSFVSLSHTTHGCQPSLPLRTNRRPRAGAKRRSTSLAIRLSRESLRGEGPTSAGARDHRH